MVFYEIRGPTHQSQIHKSFYADGVPPPFHRGVRLPLMKMMMMMMMLVVAMMTGRRIDDTRTTPMQTS